LRSGGRIENIDWYLLAAVAGLCVLGVVNLYSATRFSKPDLYVTQAAWIGLGVVVAVITAAFDYRIYERIAVPVYFLVGILLVLVLVAGTKVYGSRRWLGIGGLGIQPSELAKPALILMLAHYFHNDERLPSKGYSLWQLKWPLVMILVPVILILKEPDLGTAGVFLLIGASMVMFMGVNRKNLMVGAAALLIALPIAWFFLLHDYQRARIMSFVNPGADALGAGYHALQSMIAIGSGGLYGKGFMKGTQTQLDFLPEQHTDFIFSVFAEEWGFIFASLVILMYLVIIYRALVIAGRARERFGTLVAVGVASMVFWHVFINVGMVLGLMPVVGVTLPYFSYGGSSILMFMIGIGLLINISMRRYLF